MRARLAALGSAVRDVGLSRIALGVLAMLALVATGATAMLLVGMVLLLAGVLLAVFGWQAWSSGKGPLGFVIGGLTAVCGLALL